MDLGFLGTKRRTGDELEVLKTRKFFFGGFPGFSRDPIIQNSARSTRMIFPRTSQTPKPPKHVSKNGFLIFWGVGWGGVVRLLVLSGQYLAPNPGTRCLVLGAWYSVHGTWYMVPGWHLVLGAWHCWQVGPKIYKWKLLGIC